MAVRRILLPWDSQPQEAVELDQEGLGRGVKMLLMPLGGTLVDLINPSQVWARNGNAGIGVTSKGFAATLDGTDDYFSTTGYPNIVGNSGTFFCWMPRAGGQDTFGSVLLSTTTGGTAYYHVVDAATNAADISTARISSVGVADFFNSANTSAVFSCDGTAAGKRFFLNGASKGSPDANVPVAFASGAKVFNFGRYSGGASWDTNADTVIAGWTSEVWSSLQAEAFHANPWSLFAPRSIWVPVSAGGGAATDLTIQEAAHTHGADNLALTVTTGLTVADATHVQAADSIALTLDTFLAVADTTHAQAADNITLTTGGANLAVDEALHAQAADSAALTLDTFLTMQDATHSHAADNLALTLDVFLTVADALHAHAADNLTLTIGGIGLVIAEALHAHAADNLAFTLDTFLAVADALHAQTADNLALSLGGALSDAEFRQMYDWLQDLYGRQLLTVGTFLALK